VKESLFSPFQDKDIIHCEVFCALLVFFFRSYSYSCDRTYTLCGSAVMGVRKRKSRRAHVASATGIRKRHNLKKVRGLGASAAKVWEAKRTVREVYAKVGLSTGLSLHDGVESRKEEMVEQEEKQIPWLEIEPPKEAVPLHRHLPQGEVRFCRDLYEKYGTDYSRMERDLKLNAYQQTRKDLKRRIEKYLKEVVGKKDA
jgi:hypothetical protein